MISAGDLRDLVRVEVKDEIDDGYGGKVGTWGAYCTAWAKIERQTSFGAAAERIRAGALDAQPPARVHVRYNAETAAITTAMRIVLTKGAITTYFNVAGPPQDIDGRGRILSIMVVQGAPT